MPREVQKARCLNSFDHIGARGKKEFGFLSVMKCAAISIEKI